MKWKPGELYDRFETLVRVCWPSELRTPAGGRERGKLREREVIRQQACLLAVFLVISRSSYDSLNHDQKETTSKKCVCESSILCETELLASLQKAERTSVVKRKSETSAGVVLYG